MSLNLRVMARGLSNADSLLSKLSRVRESLQITPMFRPITLIYVDLKS